MGMLKITHYVTPVDQHITGQVAVTGKQPRIDYVVGVAASQQRRRIIEYNQVRTISH